jgi:hypothetical protein
MTLRPPRFYGQEDEDVENSEFPDRDRRRRPRPRSVSRKVVKKIEDEHENRTGDG